MKHPVPTAALDDRLGFIGTSGSGKTYNAGAAVERVLDSRGRVVIIDPLGVWWGLRLNADGKTPSKFNVVIFGGDHADLPLSEHAGALIGETAVGMAESCIIDLSALRGKAAERRFMTAFLDAIYQKANREPFHLVVDEADLFAPQKPHAGAETLLGHMEDIVRRGRVKGFIPWLISQRPAVINKNVLSQVDGLLAFKLTATQDRDALDAWIEGQADKAEGKRIKDSLPTLQIGQGIVWIPGRGVLTTASFPQKVTFDSSRTPKRGEKVKSRKLKPIDVDELKNQLASFVEQQKANDPAALKKRVAELEAAAKKPPPAPAPPKKEELDKIKLRAIAEAKKHFAPLRAALEAAMKFIVQINAKDFFKAGGETLDQKAVEKAIGEATAHITKLIEQRLTGREKQLDGLRLEAQRVVARIKTLLEKADEDVTINVDVTHNQPFSVSGSPAGSQIPRGHPDARKPARTASPASGKPLPAASGDGSLTPAKQKILDAIAWAGSLGKPNVPKDMVAFLADASPTSSSYSNNLGSLRSAGLIDYPAGGEVALTDEGAALANPPDSAPTHEAVMDKISRKLAPAMLKIVQAAADVFPEDLAKDELAERIEASATSSSFSNNLGRLRTLGFITYPTSGRVRAGESLFP